MEHSRGMHCGPYISAIPIVGFAAAALAGLSGCDTNASTTPTCLPNCAALRTYDAESYMLRAHFDWATNMLMASEDITLNLATSGIPVVELDAEVAVAAVFSGDQPLAFIEDRATGKLHVDLTPIASAGATVRFTVEYRAAPSDALLANGPRDDDPVTARVVFTDSEPDRGLRWLVAKHDPSDRARFSSEITVEADEDVIANGHRTRDDVRAGQRIIGHSLDAPIPTYLMAFAAGQLDHTDRTGGTVPLALWYRRGLAIDPNKNLDVVAQAMEVFEHRLGPYPWERYSVVLLPQYGGGMENATITFNGEQSGQGPVSFSLNAHELAHHWFGDWVTMRRYEDVWVKEGMATLLAAIAQAAPRDGESHGRLFASDFAFAPNDAIVDPLRVGLAKYTSGPYTRAAWMITQIRARVGENAFWSTLRAILEAHALDSIDGETFLRSFAPALNDAAIEQLIAALPAFDVPSIDLEVTQVEDATQVTFALTDPVRLLIAPPHVTVVDAAGAAVVHALDSGVALQVTVPAGGYLAIDEDDAHPEWDESFAVSQQTFFDFYNAVAFPTAPAALAAFTSRSASVQESVLRNMQRLPLPPEQFGPFVDALDSISARRSATLAGCSTAAAAQTDAAAKWQTALTPLLIKPAIESFNLGYARCGTALPTVTLTDELDTLVSNPTVAALPRLEYLIAFDYGQEHSLAAIGTVATSAPSLRLRDQAMNRLLEQARALYSAVAADARPRWRDFFRERLAGVTSASRFAVIWKGLLALEDDQALRLVAPLLHSVAMDGLSGRQIVCEAYALAQKTNPTAWSEFQQAANPWETLNPLLVQVLTEPKQCR